MPHCHSYNAKVCDPLGPGCGTVVLRIHVEQVFDAKAFEKERELVFVEPGVMVSLITKAICETW